MTLNILIVEDESLASKRLKRMFAESPFDIKVLATLPSVSATLSWWKQNTERIDLIFSDIQLLDGLSFHIWESISLLPPIIFTTAFDQYLLQAFKTQGIDYLLKPFMLEDLNKSIEKYLTIVEHQTSLDFNKLKEALKEPTSLMATYRNQYFRILSIDIMYIYLENGITYLQTNQQKFTINETLQKIYEKLDKASFYKVNRQVIIQKKYLQKYQVISNGNILLTMTNHQEFTVGKDKAKDFKDWFIGS